MHFANIKYQSFFNKTQIPYNSSQNNQIFVFKLLIISMDFQTICPQKEQKLLAFLVTFYDMI